jgi:hypothetical protein
MKAETTFHPRSSVSRGIYIHPFQRAFLSRWWFSTICLSTLPPSPLTAVAKPLSPEASKPYGSRKPGDSNDFKGFGVYILIGL